MMAASKHLGITLALSISLTACTDKKPANQNRVNDVAAVHVKTGCDRFYYGGREPVVVKASLAKNMKRLCYRAFSVGYSPISRTAMWSAEMIDATTVRFARKLERRDEFYPEPRLAAKDAPKGASSPRAELADYRGSGYDRGHLAPSGNMPTRAAQAESFSLANIIPQAPKLNRGSWSDLESDLRDQAFDVKRIFIVTGPVFNGRNVAVINNRIMIPSHVWKAIMIPEKGATVYIASNTDYPVWKTMSVSEFTRFSGINPFPGLDAKLADANMATGEKPGKKGAKSSRGSQQTQVTTPPWDKRNCNAPWRPTENPHYGHCHAIENSEAKYGLVPGTVGSNGGRKVTTSGTAATSPASPGAGSWSATPQVDPAARFRARNQDRARDGEKR
ncbi:DNA/RNA non-specific endonuclease [Sphingomonas sp. 3-13AW]|uniref:DNA/RNA non-specific endonuclease n=1 Tax=Sphingomonas sp. 3-13AW TaxID=3050450 RepID=UPI003BB53769